MIREICQGDIDDIYRICGNSEFLEPMSSDRVVEKNRLAHYIKNMYSFYEYGYWAVIDKASGRFIGKAGLENGQLEDENVITMGYVIDKDYRNKGYGYEVCQIILNYAEEWLQLDKIYCFIDILNVPSEMLAKKLGFVKIARMEKGKNKINIYQYELKKEQ